ncbi:MAG: PEP-CTERM sorting domain-containing protein, partial [Tepidisphaeraceae bacterium]
GGSSEGLIQLSGDGQYITLTGYSGVPADAGNYSQSTTELAQSTDTAVPRVVALIGQNESINSSTEMNDVYNTNNPRSAYSANGTTFYVSGQGDGNTTDQGVYYGPIGLNTVSTSNTPTSIYNAHDTRYVTAYNGNLYQSMDTSSGSHTGVYQYSGTPTGAQTPTLITAANNGLSGTSELFYSPDGFYFANSTTLYVADTGEPKAGPSSGKQTDGGIQKWTFANSKWTLQYTLLPSTASESDIWVPSGNPNGATTGQTGFAGITGQVVGGQVDLYAVSYAFGNDEPNGLFAIDDTLSSTTGTGETFTELETAGGDGGVNFKGVSFAPQAVPEPASFAVLSLGGALLLARRKDKKPR